MTLNISEELITIVLRKEVAAVETIQFYLYSAETETSDGKKRLLEQGNHLLQGREAGKREIWDKRNGLREERRGSEAGRYINTCISHKLYKCCVIQRRHVTHARLTEDKMERDSIHRVNYRRA